MPIKVKNNLPAKKVMENISEAFGSSVAAAQDTSAASSTAGLGDKNYHVICEKTESTVTYNYDSTLHVMKR